MPRLSRKQDSRRDLQLGLGLMTVALASLITTLALLKKEDQAFKIPENAFTESAQTKRQRPSSLKQDGSTSTKESPRTDEENLLPRELAADGISQARFRRIKEHVASNPHEAISEMEREFESADNGKAFWATAIAFVWSDELEEKSRSIPWMESAIRLGSADKNLPHALMDLYISNDDIDKAVPFIESLEQGPTKTLMTAKLLIYGQHMQKARELLESLPAGELDDSSSIFLQNYQTHSI